MKIAINRCYGGFSVSRAAQKRLVELGCPHMEGTVDEYGYQHRENIKHRSCPMLVQVITELGDKANGNLAVLKIVEVPDGIECHLDEYDGVEHVAENHEVWS